MLKKTILLSFLFTWCCTTYSLDVFNNTHLYLSGYGGWHTLFVDHVLNLSNDIRSEKCTAINQNSGVEVGGGWPLLKHVHLYLTYSHFLPNQSNSIYNILSNYKHDSWIGQTGLWDLTAYYTLWTIHPCKIYFKTGIWVLQTTISDKFTVLKQKNAKKTILPTDQTKHPIGYGGIVGLGMNWLLLRKSYITLSTDISISIYMPAPTIEWIGANAVSNIFPLVKGSVRWNIL